MRRSLTHIPRYSIVGFIFLSHQWISCILYITATLGQGCISWVSDNGVVYHFNSHITGYFAFSFRSSIQFITYELLKPGHQRARRQGLITTLKSLPWTFFKILQYLLIIFIAIFNLLIIILVWETITGPFIASLIQNTFRLLNLLVVYISFLFRF